MLELILYYYVTTRLYLVRQIKEDGHCKVRVHYTYELVFIFRHRDSGLSSIKH